MKTNTNIVELDFVNPVPIQLDDQVDLRKIYTILTDKGAVADTVDFNKWANRKLAYYTENIDYLVFDKKVENLFGGRPSKDITTTIQVALEIIANGHKELGHKMRRYLTECLRLNQARMKPANEVDAMIAKQNRRIERIHSNTPRLVEEKIHAIFQDMSEFPDDCMRIDEIALNYFPRVAKKKVLTYLKSCRHPRGCYTHVDDDGFRAMSHPFKKCGLEALATRFFAEREFVKETEKLIFWYHPWAGTMVEHKSARALNS